MSSDLESLCDEKVYSRIFKEYSNKLFHYLYYQCGDQALAQDITQEAFLKMWKSCQTIIVNTAQSYVFTSAKNLLVNVYKHEQVKLKFNRQYIHRDDHQDPNFLLEEREFQEQLDHAINALSEKERVVFLMSRIDKMKYQEIADVLGISKKAVEKRMYNALVKLRELHKGIK